VVARVRWLELQLLVPPGLLGIVGLLTVYLSGTGTTRWSWSDIWLSLAYMGIVLAISVWLSLIGFRGDQVLLPLVAMLSGLGLLLSQRLQLVLSSEAAWATLAQRQIVYLALSFALLWGTLTFLHRLEWLRRYKYTAAVSALGLTLVTMLFGVEIHGARLWLDLGLVTVQPGELVKVLLVIFLAGYLDDYRDVIATGYRAGPVTLPPLPYLLPMLVMWGVAVLAVVLQRDLGNALLLFGIFLCMLYLATGRVGYVLAGLVAFSAAVYLALQLFDHIRVRIQVWLDPWSQPLTAGFQSIQADFAFAHGHLFGTGLGFGNPQFVPVVASDYVFAAIGEELGLVGAMAVLALYLLLVARGLMIALLATESFTRLLTAGLTVVVALQTLIILAGTVRLLPLTGITLPFISAGGSSLVTNFLIVALLLKASEATGATR